MNNISIFSKYFDTQYMQEYCSGIFSDELDKLGYEDQVCNDWKLNNSKNRMFGRVRTMEIETVRCDDEKIEKGLGFLTTMERGEILVVDSSNNFAYFGELMSRLSIECGLGGAIINGLTRDTYFTQDIEYPVFAKGYSPKDIKGRGRVGELDDDIIVDGVKVRSGDYVFGDSDAVVFIPQEVFEELVPKINAAAEEEYRIKDMITKGKSLKEILKITKSF